MRVIETPLAVSHAMGEVPLSHDPTGSELKRGAFLNTIAMLASNFRGVFTFLVARLLGPAALGTFSVAWANTDLISKVAVFGLDETITTFIARSQAVGDLARAAGLSRAHFSAIRFASEPPLASVPIPSMVIRTSRTRDTASPRAAARGPASGISPV